MIRDLWDNWKQKKSTWIALVILVIVVIGLTGSLITGAFNDPGDVISEKPDETSSSEIEFLPDDPMIGNVTGSNSVIVPDSAKDVFRQNYDKLNMPGVLKYPATEPLASQSYVSMGDDFKIGITKNWLANIDANDVSLIHTSGPSISIQQSKLTDDFTVSQVNNALREFLDACEIKEAFANDIFLKDKVIGRLCSALYEVDGESHILDCAIFLCDKEVYTMISLYTSDNEEFVTALYRAITYKGNPVQFK